MPRQQILKSYGEWTALSALRSGAPIKSAADIYPLLRKVPFDEVLDVSLGPIDSETFNEWHRKAVVGLMAGDERLKNQAGWAAKMVNVYLKTVGYVGGGGRAELTEHLHPPVDGGLWRGIERKFRGEKSVLDKTHCVRSIKAITDYDKYSCVISGMREAASRMGVRLIEVEKLWEPDK